MERLILLDEYRAGHARKRVLSLRYVRHARVMHLRGKMPLHNERRNAPSAGYLGELDGRFFIHYLTRDNAAVRALLSTLVLHLDPLAKLHRTTRLSAVSLVLLFASSPSRASFTLSSEGTHVRVR